MEVKKKKITFNSPTSALLYLCLKVFMLTDAVHYYLVASVLFMRLVSEFQGTSLFFLYIDTLAWSLLSH